ncbi:MAG TPA: flagellar biosynthetic protein FliR [Bryobacteraceae bacterium]|nr:flagellar biosynthetic protein FliR [Bryobacteraceae bacterium]
MPGSLTLSVGTLYAFLLVLARVGGAIVFVPLPGVKAVPEPMRVAFVLAFTFALYGRWPAVDASSVTALQIVTWILSEAALGIAIGVSVAIVLETFALAAQILGQQAGYGYASMIDPNTEADSGILLVMAQLMGGMLFFAVGLDREILRLFALSLEKVPAGAYLPGPLSAQNLIKLGSGLFSVGVRLALPVVALLVMVDVALALLGRLNSQLQLIQMAFPAKMLTALLILSWVASLFPRVLMEFSGHAWASARQLMAK